MKSKLPLPKDAMESLESWLKGETETLDYKDVAISPTRTREKIVFKEVYVEKKPEPEPGPEGSVGGVDASVASNSDDSDKDSDNDSDDDDKENGSEDAESESDLEDFYAQADSIDVAMKKSESKTKVGSKKEKKKASKKDKKKKGSADSILAEIEALKAAAANNPNINRAQVLGAIAQLEEEVRSCEDDEGRQNYAEPYLIQLFTLAFARRRLETRGSSASSRSKIHYNLTRSSITTSRTRTRIIISRLAWARMVPNPWLLPRPTRTVMAQTLARRSCRCRCRCR